MKAAPRGHFDNRPQQRLMQIVIWRPITAEPLRSERPGRGPGQPSQFCQQPFRQAQVRSYGIRSTHCARDGPGSNGSAKYWVSLTTLPSTNSMMLTVWDGRPS